MEILEQNTPTRLRKRDARKYRNGATGRQVAQVAPASKHTQAVQNEKIVHVSHPISHGHNNYCSKYVLHSIFRIVRFTNRPRFNWVFYGMLVFMTQGVERKFTTCVCVLEKTLSLSAGPMSSELEFFQNISRRVDKKGGSQRF